MVTLIIQHTNGDWGAHEIDDGTGFTDTQLWHRADSNTVASSRFVTGLFFPSITIAVIDTINKCIIKVSPTETIYDDANEDIYFEDEDNTNNFAVEADVIDRTLTSASVAWVVTGLGTATVESPSLITPFQEVIDRAGWVENNDVTVIVRGKSDNNQSLRIQSFEGDSGLAPILQIEYTEGFIPPPNTSFPILGSIEASSKPVYELWLTDDFGNRIAQLQAFLSLEASQVVNQIGFFNLTMPQSFDINLIQPDRMVQLWRAPRGGRLTLWRVYFIRKWEFSTIGSDQIVSFGGPDTNELLRRRIVATFSASAQARKTDFADDMMKEIVTEAIADGVAPVPTVGTRVWADLSIASDLGLGPTITKSYPFKKLLTTSGQGVLPGLAKAAKEAGTEVFFDVVPDVITGSTSSFQFQTFTGQPGQDQTSRVVFDAIRNNMANPRLEYDYTEEENYIYAGGQGEEADRNIQQVSDSDRYSISQWSRIEGFADARNQDSDNAVRESGRDKLNLGRPKRRFSAIPLDVTGTRFGRDWDFGDKVTARYLNIEFDTIIRAVTISVDGNGNETIRARLDFED